MAIVETPSQISGTDLSECLEVIPDSICESLKVRTSEPFVVNVSVMFMAGCEDGSGWKHFGGMSRPVSTSSSCQKEEYRLDPPILNNRKHKKWPKACEKAVEVVFLRLARQNPAIRDLPIESYWNMVVTVGGKNKYEWTSILGNTLATEVRSIA